VKNAPKIADAHGKLGILLVGLGAVNVTCLDGPNVKTGANKRELAEQLREDVRQFRSQHSPDELKSTLRYLRGDDLITHLGLEYYD
jgi:hypothetical protein